MLQGDSPTCLPLFLNNAVIHNLINIILKYTQRPHLKCLRFFVIQDKNAQTHGWILITKPPVVILGKVSKYNNIMYTYYYLFTWICSYYHQRIKITAGGSVIYNHARMGLFYSATHFCFSNENSTVNYLAYNYSENVDVLESKFEPVVFDIFNFGR